MPAVPPDLLFIGAVVALLGFSSLLIPLRRVFLALPTESPTTFQRIGAPQHVNDAVLKLVALRYALFGLEVISPPSPTAVRFRLWLRISAAVAVFGAILWTVGFVWTFAHLLAGGSAA